MFETKRPTVPAAEEILGGYFRVHNHGFVALVDYMGGDEDIERAARVSYGYGTRATSQTRGLIRYLRRHLHTTPSEMVELKFHCAMPMFVARQWIRHRTANVNEYSGRYSLVPMLFYSPEFEHFALQSTQNNQGRQAEPASEGLYRATLNRWEEMRLVASDTYSWLTGEDLAKELARIDLPLSTYTQWYWKIDLHNLLHFLRLRVDTHAQYEIRVYGEVMAGMVKRLAPLSYEAWIDYNVAGAHMSYGELEVLRSIITPCEDENSILSQSEHLNRDEMSRRGLSKREIDEFMTKLNPASKPDFELDPTKMVDSGVLEQEMADAVPSVDRR